MTSARDPIVTSARIVTPEEAATSSSELAMMKIALRVAQARGAPLHIVQFADGIATMVLGDPNDTDTWYSILEQIHQAAVAGHSGSIDVSGRRKS